MNKEFKKIVSKTETRYVLEAASAGATSSGAVATGPAGKKGNLLVQGKDEKPVVQRRNPVAANVNATVGGGGAGAHKDKKKVIPRKEKHKKDFRKEVDEGWGAGSYDGMVKSTYAGKHNLVPEMDSHYIDQENDMTSSSLGSLYKQAVKLRDLIKKMGDDTTLEPWQQEKIAKASDYVNSVFRSLDDKYGLDSLEEEKQKGVDGKACWKGYKRMGTKKKGGKTVDNCVKVNEEVDPEIQVPGWGVVSLERLKKHVKELSKDFNDWIQTDKFVKAAYHSEQFFNALLALAKALKQASAKLDEAEKKGLWANIHARRKKGLPPRKPGEKGAPTKKSWDAAVSTSKKKRGVGEDNLQEYERYRYTDDDGNEWEIDDEGNKTLLNPSRYSGGYKPRYSRPYNPMPRRGSSQPKVYYFYNVPDGSAMKAYELGLKRTKSGKWYSSSPSAAAEKEFGKGREWRPKTNEAMLPAVSTSKKKRGVGEDNLQEYERYRYTDDDGNEWEIDDEGNKTLLNPSRYSGGYKPRYSRPYNPMPRRGSSQPKVYYFYNVPDGSAMKAYELGLKRTKSGKWYSSSPIDAATAEFGNPRKWEPKAEESMMPLSHFAGTPKNKLGPAAHLKGKMKRPARQGDLVGGGAEESLNELASYGSNKAYQSQGTYKRYNLFVSKKPSTLGSLQGFYIAVAEHPRTLVAVHKAKSKNPEDAVNDIKGLIDKELDQATKVSQNATVDFNVDFVREILPAIDYEPTDFYAKIIDGPRLIIAGLDIIDDSELLKAGGFQKSSIRTVKTSDTAAKLPAIPLSAARAQAANLIANGRYVIKNERKDKYGNFVFDLEFDSVVSAPNEKVKMGEPALTIGTVRSVSSENVKKKTLKKN